MLDAARLHMMTLDDNLYQVLQTDETMIRLFCLEIQEISNIDKIMLNNFKSLPSTHSKQVISKMIETYKVSVLILPKYSLETIFLQYSVKNL